MVVLRFQKLLNNAIFFVLLRYISMSVSDIIKFIVKLYIAIFAIGACMAFIGLFLMLLSNIF